MDHLKVWHDFTWQVLKKKPLDSLFTVEYTRKFSLFLASEVGEKWKKTQYYKIYRDWQHT